MIALTLHRYRDIYNLYDIHQFMLTFLLFSCIFNWFKFLLKPVTYAYNDKECFLLPVDSLINKLISTTSLPKVDWSTFSETCFWGLLQVHECSEAHWMPLVSLYRPPPSCKYYPICWWYKPWISVYFVTFWVEWGP